MYVFSEKALAATQGPFTRGAHTDGTDETDSLNHPSGSPDEDTELTESLLQEPGAGQDRDRDGPGNLRLVTEDEVTVLVGFINLVLTAIYIGAYSAAGEWRPRVTDPIKEKGGDPTLVLAVWAIDSVLYFAHYSSFYYCCRYSAVSAAVNKASQAAAVFFGSSLAFCERDEKQCLTNAKIAASLVVIAGVLLYGIPPATCVRICRPKRNPGRDVGGSPNLYE